MDGHCSYCGSGVFETDRNCRQCGAPTFSNIKIEEQLEERTIYESFESYAKREIIALAIEGGDFELPRSTRKKVSVWAISENKAPFILPPNSLNIEMLYQSLHNSNFLNFQTNNTGQIEVWTDKMLFKSNKERDEVRLAVSLIANPFVETMCKITVIN